MSESKLNENVAITEDVLKARREARGRKILENAKSRLEKLSNEQVKKNYESKKGEQIINDDSKNNSPEKKVEVEKDRIINDFVKKIREQDKFPDPEIESELEFGPKFNYIPNLQQHDQFQELNQTFLWQQQQQQPNQQELFWQQSSNNNINPFDLNNDFSGQQMFANFNSQQNNNLQTENLNNSNTKLNIIIKNKLHLIVISILTYILSRNENFATFSVFLPLLIWELTETFLLKTNNASNDFILVVVFMFAGVSPKTANLITKVLGILNKIFKDVGVFVFFFVICHLIAKTFF